MLFGVFQRIVFHRQFCSSKSSKFFARKFDSSCSRMFRNETFNFQIKIQIFNILLITEEDDYDSQDGQKHETEFQHFV